MGYILVVDDEEMNRDMLSRRLGKKGYEVLVADSGPVALDLLSKEEIDLVLLDIRLILKERHNLDLLYGFLFESK